MTSETRTPPRLPEFLVRKYDKPVPRYTSYPTAPRWNGGVDASIWSQALALHAWNHEQHHQKPSCDADVYVHLPFCEQLCSFCGCHKIVTGRHDVERPYVDAILSEWALHKAAAKGSDATGGRGGTLGVASLHLGGGTPTFFSPESLARLLEGLVPKGERALDFQGSFEAHPNSTTPEHLRVLAEFGFKRMSLGVQDLDPRVQETIGRIHDVEQVAAVVAAARRAGFRSVNFDLIHGLPGQTPTSLRRTADAVVSLRPDRIAFYPYAHMPRLKPGQSRLSREDLPNAVEREALYDAGAEHFLRAGYVAIGMDHFALPGDALARSKARGLLHRNFMGYCDRPTPLLVGLGLSSISEVEGRLFAQNEKSLPAYLASLAEGRLPVVHGHVFDATDAILRRHILDLVCLNETFWDTDAAVMGCLADAIGRLGPLEDDGLVQVLCDGIVVTPLGERFLKHICRAFDARQEAFEGSGKGAISVGGTP